MLDWGVPRLRDLPWRRTRDPWAVLVSEVMLQQTQVSRVIPRWHAFLDAFPDTAACAVAPLGDVLREWQGLGYPRRARNLHAAATEVERRGAFPTTLEELLSLPGVGHYTARALLAFAFEIDAAVVDTNIARVHARHAGRRLTPREVQARADDWAPAGQAWEWNQCIMDLGALLCRPSAPQCDECPLHRTCAWRGRGDDPATGSAGVSRPQSRFEGSDRQARGRLMKALSAGSVELAAIGEVMHRDAEHAQRLLDALVTEGLVVVAGSVARLP